MVSTIASENQNPRLNDILAALPLEDYQRLLPESPPIL
jgi:hypothetical protein